MAGFPKGKKILGAVAKQNMQGVDLYKTIDKDALIKLIHKVRGNLSRVADQIGCHRSTIANRVEKESDLKQAVHDARQRWIDDIEDSAREQAANGDTTMGIFMLKTQGRSRGYDQDMRDNAQDIARAAFDFVMNRSKNPAES